MNPLTDALHIDFPVCCWLSILYKRNSSLLCRQSFKLFHLNVVLPYYIYIDIRLYKHSSMFSSMS